METTLPKLPHSEFLHPRPELAQCILGGFVRDTRGCALPAAQRFNHFAALPMCSLSLMFEGTGRIMMRADHFEDPQSVAPMEKVLFSGPQSQPMTSWNDGDIYAMVVVFYPDAMSALLGVAMEGFIHKSVPLGALPAGPVRDALEQAFASGDAGSAFATLQDSLAPLWQDARPSQSNFGRMIGDWSQSLILNAALSPTGRSLRQVQRRVKAATGQPIKRLQTYTKAEDAFVLALKDRDVDLAGIATDAGYSDQSHMGRHVRAQTGFTPTELMQRVESDEAFWSYRLMGERY
jgi:AraC-like DNA-binding protein